MKRFRYISGVSTLQVNKEKCIGCGLCQTTCPQQALYVDNNKVSVNNASSCMECGACVSNCPTDALSVMPGVGCASYIIQKWLKGKDAIIECC